MFLEINGSHIDNLPFQDLVKVSDLLSFEGNIVLSHYVDKLDNNYLFYWVDFHDGKNRWLVCKVSKRNLYYYLNSSASLNELIFDGKENPFLFLIDNDGKGQIVNGYLVIPENLPDSYKPDNDNFFDYDFPTSYNTYFTEYSYINLLRKNAIYFTLNAKTNKFGDTVGTKDAADFLININKSYNEYSEYSFFEAFKNTTSDQKKLKRTFSSLQESKSLRICDMSFNSFHVAISSDPLLRDDEIDKVFNDWNNGLIESYKNDVMDNDFSNDDDIKSIIEKFPDPELRKRIFEPIIKIIESPNVNLKVNNQSNTFRRTYKEIKKKSKEIIIPKPSIEEIITDMFPKRKIIQVYIEVPQDENVTDLSKKTIKDNLLFSQETNEYPIRIDSIKYGKMTFELMHPLLIKAILNENGVYQLDFFSLNIHVEATDKDQLIPLFNWEFYKNYYKTTEQALESELANEFTKLISNISYEEDVDIPF